MVSTFLFAVERTIRTGATQMVRFPYARGYEAPDELFLALWKIWFDRFAPSGWDLARTGRLPRLHSRDVLRVQLEK